MKDKTKNEIRAEFIENLMNYFAENGEDCEKIASNSFNFPYSRDDEECFVEIVVKIPKYDDDEGYAKRQEYEMKLKLQADKKAEKEKQKQKKIEADQKRRAEKSRKGE